MSMAPHMARRASPRAQLAFSGRALLLAAIYFALGRVGPALTPMSGFATLVWPASGVALAALLLFGYGLWPGIALGALATEMALGAPPLVAMGIAAGNTLQAALGAFALRRIPWFQPSLQRLKDVLALALLAAMVSPILGATVGTACLALGQGVPFPFAQTWIMWWSGDLIGILVIAPLVLTWARGPRPSARSKDAAWAALLGGVLWGGSTLLFSPEPMTPWLHILRPYVLFLPLLWASLNYGVLGAATGMLLVAIPALRGTYAGHGIFAHAGLIESLGALHVFLFTASLASLVLGAVVSERQRSQESLSRTEEQQRLALEAAQLGMWCWSRATGALLWTPRCRDIHGLGREEELTQDRFLTTLYPADRVRVEGAIRRSFEERADYRVEYRVVWPDRSVHWVSVLGKAFFDEGGAPQRMMGVALDVTAQQEAEISRAALLERERAARAEAQAATRAKDEFLAVVSHELRTPLQSMLGWTQMLLDRPTDERTLRKGLKTIDRNVKTQAQLIEDLLDVSRIVAGKLSLERVRVDLAEVVASAVESARGAADARAIQLNATIASLHGEVVGDPGRLEQVLSNLISNAVKFTPHGGRVDVRIARDGPSARIIVEDSGIGIAPEFVSQVFDRFRQAESTTRRAHGGLGLGLSIVRHIVEMHGGAVKAESPGVGRGATFTVTLPLISSACHAVRSDRLKSKSRSTAAPVELNGVRVLVVDDDPDARELLESALHESGADVRAVPSVRAALVELPRFLPDLILSDIGMPEEDGYALIRQVRARERAEGGHVPAVALTAFASQADREQALALGFEEHLTKPTSPAELARTVARLVGKAV